MIDSTLIYPNIHFKDSKSVKEALLLYENLYRIVPEDVKPEDCEEIRKLIQNYDVIKDITPSKYIEDTYEKFKNNLDRWKKAEGMCFSGKEEKYEKLHKGKVYDKLRKIIVDDGILEFDGTWFGGDDSFIGSYMTYLALEISRKNSLSLVTYEPAAWTCEEYLNYDGKFATVGEEKTHALISIYLADYIPSNINKIAFDDLIKFRDRYREERRKILKEFLKFQNEIESRTDKIVIDDKIKDQMKSLNEKVKNFKEACSFLKADKFMGLKIFTMPVAIQQAEPFIENPVLKGLLIPFGITLGTLWSIYSSHKSIESFKKSNSYSYLVLMEKYKFKEISRLQYGLSSNIHEFLED